MDIFTLAVWLMEMCIQWHCVVQTCNDSFHHLKLSGMSLPSVMLS